MNNYKTRYGDTPISRKYPDISEDVFPNTSLRSPKERPPNYLGNCYSNDKMNHFMAMACLASLRSKDPTRQVYRHNIMTMNPVIILNIGWSMPC
jgi:hypothetical protein